MDSRTIDIENVLWKEDYFSLEASSTQIKNQWYHRENVKNIDKNDYYSTIVLNNKLYYCVLYLANNDFSIDLYNPNTNEYEYFYNDFNDFYESIEFISGFGTSAYKKVRGKDYKYIMNITLKETGQYYYYCIDNNIEFPTTLTLYGYIFNK